MVNHWKAELRQFNQHTHVQRHLCNYIYCEPACSRSTRGAEDNDKTSVLENSELLNFRPRIFVTHFGCRYKKKKQLHYQRHFVRNHFGF